MVIVRLIWLLSRLALASVVLCWSLVAQTKEVPSFRIKSDLVLVDLIVTSKGAGLIRDLKPSEIEVYEDGKKQKVTFFRLIGGAVGREPVVGLAEEPPKNGELWVPDSKQLATVLVVLVDLNNMEFNDLARSKGFIVNFIQSQLDRNDQVMIATIRHGLKIQQPFTGDSAKLIRAVEGISPMLRSKTSFTHFFEVVEGIFQNTVNMRGDTTLAIQMALAQARMFLDRLRASIGHSRSAISALSGYLRSLPGRKQIVYYSSGYPLNPERHLESIIETVAGSPGSVAGELSYRGDARSALRAASDHTNRSQVSVYSIDVRGLKAGWGNAARQGSMRTSYSRYISRDVTAPQDFLRILSNESGGLCFLNGNDLGEGLRQAYLEGKEYYLVGYIPNTRRKRGKYHRIKVKINRTTLNVRSRRGYFEEDEESLFQSDLRNSLKFPELYRSFPVEIDASAAGEGKVQIRLFVPSSGIMFTFENLRYQCRFETFGALMDIKGKWVGKSLAFSEVFRMDMPVSEWMKKVRNEFRFNGFLLAARPSFSATVDIEVSPGNYNLIVAVRQLPANKMATVSREISVK